MSIIRLQSETERRKGVYYEFDSADTPLGEGGMGKVYKGLCCDERTGLSKRVAIKFMFSDLPSHVIERSRREANIQIRHDNVVQMLGFIEIDEPGALGQVNKRFHVVSELLEGVMLDDLLQGKTTDQNGTQIPFALKLYKDYTSDPCHFAIYVVKSILSGIMALHDAGYIHRDLDPTNIMVTSDGHIKLIDFGIAKQLSSLNSQDKALTSDGQFIGKAQYAAPELVVGDIRHQDRTTDVYAIGMLLFQFIVGHLPFEGATYEVLEMQLHKKLPLSLIKQKKVREVINKATRKKQSERYQSAAEFRVAVEQLEKLPYTQNNSLGRVLGFVKKKELVYSISILVLIVIGIFAFGNFNLNSDGVITNNVNTIISAKPPIRKDYNYAVDLLKESRTAQEGIVILDSLSQNGNYNARYMLSRLYFSKSGEYVPDTIKMLKENLSSFIHNDNSKAHELLKQAVSLKQDDYTSLYELGADFLAGKVRTNIPNSRNLDEAYWYLSKARQLAEENKDSTYTELIKRQLDLIPTSYKK